MKRDRMRDLRSPEEWRETARSGPVIMAVGSREVGEFHQARQRELPVESAGDTTARRQSPCAGSVHVRGDDQMRINLRIRPRLRTPYARLAP